MKLFFGNPTNWPTIQLVLSSNWFILVSFCIEKYGFAKSVLNEFSGLILITLNLTMVLALSPIVIQFIDCHPIGSSIACSVYSILSLKLVSYHMVNYWCRKKIQYELSNHKEKTTVTENEKEKATVIENHKEKTVTDEDKINSNVKENGTASNSKKSDYSKRIVRYPNNLHLNDMYYFIFAPTLCYELNFPRNERIRKRFLMKRLLEIVSQLPFNISINIHFCLNSFFFLSLILD